MHYYSKEYPQGLQEILTSVTTSCSSYVHASTNPQVYVLNEGSHGLKMLENVCSLNFGGTTSRRECIDTICYALDLQE